MTHALAPLVVVTGTGTGIGKTHLACALVAALRARALGFNVRLVHQAADVARRERVVAGWKPIESGLTNGVGPDHAALLEASTFHVKQLLTLACGLDAPVSPHLAARIAGLTIDLGEVVTRARNLRTKADVVVVELPGGLFTPLTPSQLNVDLVAALEPTSVLLVAKNRLGVLHDVLAATRAATASCVALTAVVLSPRTPLPTSPDASVSSNAEELRAFLRAEVIELPRASVETLAVGAEVSRIVDAVLGAP